MNAGFDVALHGMRLTMKGSPAPETKPPHEEKKTRSCRPSILSLDATHAVRLAALAVAILSAVVLTAVWPPCVYARAWASVALVLTAVGMHHLRVQLVHADALMAAALLTLASSASRGAKDTVLILALVACSAHAVARSRSEHAMQQFPHMLITPGLACVLIVQSAMVLAFWGELSEQFKSALLVAFLALYAVCLSIPGVLK